MANLGLIGKMTGCAAIVSNVIKRVNERILIDTNLKALGTFGEYSSLYNSSSIRYSSTDIFLKGCTSHLSPI